MHRCPLCGSADWPPLAAEAAALVRSVIDAQPSADILQGLTRESAEKLLSLAVQGGLLSEAFVPSTTADRSPIEDDPRGVVQHLLDAGRLTTWQSEHLLAGRYKGFFLGSYKLLAHLDRGESCSVFLGEHMTLATRRAVAVRSPLYVADRAAMAWLERRLRIVAAMDHVNIIRIHEAKTDGNVHYLVREYVDGCNLAALLNHAGRLSPHLAAALVLQIAEAAAYADSQNCPLPTIEAENVLVSRDGLVRMQPAQLSLGYQQNSRVDDQSNGMAPGFPPGDVDGLGRILFQLLTGCLPAAEGDPIEHDLSALRPALPDWLNNVCLRALGVGGQPPFPTATDVCQALRQGAARSDWPSG